MFQKKTIRRGVVFLCVSFGNNRGETGGWNRAAAKGTIEDDLRRESGGWCVGRGEHACWRGRRVGARLGGRRHQALVRRSPASVLAAGFLAARSAGRVRIDHPAKTAGKAVEIASSVVCNVFSSSAPRPSPSSPSRIRRHGNVPWRRPWAGRWPRPRRG